MKRKTIHLFGACALLLASCTNLDPDIYSDMTIDKILEDSEQSSAYLLTPMYGQMRWFNEDRSIWDLTSSEPMHGSFRPIRTEAGMTAVSGCGWTITNGNRPTPISVLVGATCGMALRPAATGCCISSKRPGWSSTSKRWRRFVPCVHSIIITCCLFSGMCRSWRPTTCRKIICRRRATGKRCMISSCGNCARAWTNCPKNSGTVVLTSGLPSICWQRYI